MTADIIRASTLGGNMSIDLVFPHDAPTRPLVLATMGTETGSALLWLTADEARQAAEALLRHARTVDVTDLRVRASAAIGDITDPAHRLHILYGRLILRVTSDGMTVDQAVEFLRFADGFAAEEDEDQADAALLDVLLDQAAEDPDPEEPET